MSENKKSGQAATLDYADWIKWDPKSYLNTYFQSLGTDSFEAWNFLVRELRTYKDNPQLILDFGTGPTLFSSIPAAPYATELHLAEYLEPNRKELSLWLDNAPDCFSWDSCIKDVITIEGNKADHDAIVERSDLLRKKITKLSGCDASLEFPMGSKIEYPLVISTYCADSATSSKDTWKLYMKNILGLVAPEGTILLTALRECTYYKVGNFNFPCANINEQDIEDVLIQNGFPRDQIHLEVCDAKDCIEEGFTGLVFARAKKI